MVSLQLPFLGHYMHRHTFPASALLSHTSSVLLTRVLGGWNLSPQGTAFGICAAEQAPKRWGPPQYRGSQLFALWNLIIKMNFKTAFHDWTKGPPAYRSTHVQMYFIQKCYTTCKFSLPTDQLLILQICFLQIFSLSWSHRCICYSVLNWSTFRKGFNPQRVFHWSCFSLIFPDNVCGRMERSK